MISRATLLALAVISTSAFAADKQAAIAPGKTFRDCPTCPEMVVIPPGKFTMGTRADAKEVDPSRFETPQQDIAIGYKFALGRTEVTRAQYKQFVKETGHQTKPQCRVFDGEWKESDNASWERPRQPEKPTDKMPVACVSWNDAVAFTEWLTKKTGHRYRLPNVAEWEYAARAGTTTSRFWGDNPDDACAYANVFDIASAAKHKFPWKPAQCTDGWAELAPVSSYKPNQFGLYDMIGNVWEWQFDCFGGPYANRPKDGSPQVIANCEMHDNRGGGWMTAPERNRLAWPGRDKPDQRSNYFGFRVARSFE